MSRQPNSVFERPIGSQSGIEKVGRNLLETPPGTVLVVDDDNLIRAAHLRVLGQAGIGVMAVSSASDALDLLASGKQFDAIVADVVMPGMDGVTMLQEVRKLLPDIPVVLVTGNPHLDTAVAAMKHGGFRYLIKPVVAEELVTVVQEAIGLNHLAWLKREGMTFLESHRQEIDDRTNLETYFTEAIDRLWIAYQPIVNWRQRSLFGYEALVRTSSMALGNPMLLFGAAERLGRVRELGRRIRSMVAVEIEQAPPDVAIFVNLHVSDLNDDELFCSTSALAKHAQRVVLEVTERSSLESVSDVPGRMAQLRSLGYRVAVDDLGAGYAGLSSFTQLEPEVAKLDMSLIRDIDKSARKQSVVRSMIRVCSRELGVQVVCEGVETEAERDTLDSLGTSFSQGYLFGRPAPGFSPVVFDPTSLASGNQS